MSYHVVSVNLTAPDGSIVGESVTEIEVGEPDWDNTATCAVCGFDSLVAVPVWMYRADGVETLPPHLHCPRCANDDEDDE